MAKKKIYTIIKDGRAHAMENYKTKLTTTTGEWQTPVVCPHCHTPLAPYGGCQTCNERWIKNMYNDLGRKDI